jgi:TonB family protein
MSSEKWQRMPGSNFPGWGVWIEKMSKSFKALRRAGESRPPGAQEANFWEALAKPLERRQTPRRALDFVVRVYGCSADERPFYEDAHTISVGALGARLVLSIPVSGGQRLLLINEAAQKTQACRVVNSRSRNAETFEVGVQFSMSRAEFWPNLESELGDRLSGNAPPPRLDVDWTGRSEEIATSVFALLRWPLWPKRFNGGPFFRDCWIQQPLPLIAFLAAITIHALLVLFPPPIWNVRPARKLDPKPEMELAWYGPVKDLPAILAQRRPVKKPAPPKDAPKRETERPTDSAHSRQTIITEPLHVTHPRQTLIQPAAAPEPPKLLPALPNIVQLGSTKPVRPQLQLTPEQLAAMRPQALAPRAVQDAEAPQVSLPEKQAGAINIASSAAGPPKPVLRVSPMSAPRAEGQKKNGSEAAPEIALDNSAAAKTLIALSATPAAVPPPPSMPPGNLAARISIAPQSLQPGSPADASIEKTDLAGGSAGSHVPDGIFVSVGRPVNPSSTSALGIGSELRSAGGVPASRAAPRVAAPPADAKANPSGLANLIPGAPPESVLGAKHVYTLHVNMPNLTSATGSWILNFVEMGEQDAAFMPKPESAEMAGPVPLRKVDPKYPPELRAGRVEGEVVLYAVIRKDGTVDSIQLVRGVDPILDANAMGALAQWKFQPAEKSGAPIDLEAVVHIPFRSRVPVY